jgi:hypothetical protein
MSPFRKRSERTLDAALGIAGALFCGAAALADEPAETASSAEGGIACGPALACEQTTQYCHIVVGGPGGVPSGYSCADLPEGSLSPPTCENMADAWIGCECTESSGGITVTCKAP